MLREIFENRTAGYFRIGIMLTFCHPNGVDVSFMCVLSKELGFNLVPGPVIAVYELAESSRIVGVRFNPAKDCVGKDDGHGGVLWR